MDAQSLKCYLQSQNQQGIALDIDETLADTNRHWFDTMYQLIPLPEHTKEELLKEFKWAEHVPGWDNPEAHEHMTSFMHSAEFNEQIPLIENANHVVNKIHTITPVVAYITARPEAVRESTGMWLQKHSFPEAPILMRPQSSVSKEFSQVKNIWKAHLLLDLCPVVYGIVDDNAGLAQELENLGYTGTLYLYGPQSGSFEHHPHLVVCPTWDHVLRAFQ